ncbi:MAG: hypothetical protein ACJ73D_03885 [Pyrinomonadaceae bacterium]
MHDKRFMDDGWRLVPRGDVAPHWSGLYVTMNPRGYLHMSGLRIGFWVAPKPFGFCITRCCGGSSWLRWRRASRTRILQASAESTGAELSGQHRLITQHNLRPSDTIEFLTPTIGENNILMLDFNKVRVSPKAHSQCRGRRAEWKW